MSKDPAVLFYTSDFLTGTEFFTFEQKGQYIHLLCVQHQNGHLPEEYMLKILNSINNPVWGKFKKDENGHWFQQRMNEEKTRRSKYSESRRKNAKHRYAGAYADTYAGSMHDHMETETETVTVIKDKRKLINNRPSLEDVIKYCSERKNTVDPEKWFNYYESNGWMVGKNKMKKWKAAVRTWERNGFNKTNKEAGIINDLINSEELNDKTRDG